MIFRQKRKKPASSFSRRFLFHRVGVSAAAVPLRERKVLKIKCDENQSRIECQFASERRKRVRKRHLDASLWLRFPSSLLLVIRQWPARARADWVWFEFRIQIAISCVSSSPGLLLPVSRAWVAICCIRAARLFNGSLMMSQQQRATKMNEISAQLALFVQTQVSCFARAENASPDSAWFYYH